MKAVIFGSNGQDGFYLGNHLKEQGITTIGISRKNADVVGEVQNRGLVEEIIKQQRPDFVFHLAANSTTKHEVIWENHETISTGSLNILEAVKNYSRNTKVFLSGSGLQFENNNLPIDENGILVATSPYVISRNHSLFAARYYRSLGIRVYFGFFFNHDSPRRSNRHISQKIANYCRLIESNSDPLEIGNIHVKKEWTFAGDVVKAIWLLVKQDKIFECVIGSGISYSIQEWLDICFNLVGKNWKDYIVIREGFIPEYNTLVSNPAIIKSLGWKQEVSINDLAKIMLLKVN